jgi:uncharacterized protein (DUF1697 family)
MARYVASLRGVSPVNAKMADLKRCFEAAGFSDVRTLLSSGNVAFTTRAASASALERRITEAMRRELDRVFETIVRPTANLQALVEADPFAAFDLPPAAKRVVTFLRQPPRAAVDLPPERDGVRILKVDGAEVFTAYVPSEKGPVFMVLLERTFGVDITTRTFDTVRKCAAA